MSEVVNAHRANLVVPVAAEPEIAAAAPPPLVHPLSLAAKWAAAWKAGAPGCRPYVRKSGAAARRSVRATVVRTLVLDYPSQLCTTALVSAPFAVGLGHIK